MSATATRSRIAPANFDTVDHDDITNLVDELLEVKNQVDHYAKTHSVRCACEDCKHDPDTRERRREVLRLLSHAIEFTIDSFR